MLTAAQVAQQLGISARAVYDIPAGELARHQFGRAVRYAEEDVEAYRKARPATAPAIGQLPARVLREYERLRLRTPEDERPPALTPNQQAIADRRMRRMRRPPWADPKAILALYAEAKRLTIEAGIPHHVDHVIPLQGEFVTGLHVETNLQILTGVENSRKSNRFEVE